MPVAHSGPWRILDTAVLIWIACAISFTLGWWAHAQIVKNNKGSHPADHSRIEKEIDLTIVESGVKARNKRAG